MEKFFGVILVIVMVLVILLFFGLLMALPVMLLWNWVMPKIFHLTQINIYQAFGLFLLGNLITGGSMTKASFKKEK